ncbi:MAG TPA: hypothetical protein VM222_05840 [Planctomycetota bacterium]|nr:hypothetical protein [Planctomycetota bacterium]
MKSKSTVLVIVGIAVVAALIAKGGDGVAAVVITVVMVGAGCFVALLVAAIPIGIVESILAHRKLEAAIREYQELQVKHGASSKDHCPHRVFTIGQTDYVVLTATDKWCKVCGKHLGTATLKKGFWKNRWV